MFDEITQSETQVFDMEVAEVAPASDASGAGAVYNVGAVEKTEARDH